MKKITFGRLSDNDIVLDNQAVSRYHGYLTIDGSRVYVADNDSTNGTFVNGERIDGKVPLRSGDKVMIANKIKLDWQRYAPMDAKTVRNEEDYTYRQPERPQYREKPAREEKKTSFWDGQGGKIVKYILTMIVSVTVMTLVTTLIRKLLS
ncbi:MAG: FHA domain-containing protein [Paludibacteraceae bacterium]|nr:FHA domain-containing protein [Paludibacteraceae bacterium]